MRFDIYRALFDMNSRECNNGFAYKMFLNVLPEDFEFLVTDININEKKINFKTDKGLFYAKRADDLASYDAVEVVSSVVDGEELVRSKEVFYSDYDDTGTYFYSYIESFNTDNSVINVCVTGTILNSGGKLVLSDINEGIYVYDQNSLAKIKEIPDGKRYADIISNPCEYIKNGYSFSVMDFTANHIQDVFFLKPDFSMKCNYSRYTGKNKVFKDDKIISSLDMEGIIVDGFDFKTNLKELFTNMINKGFSDKNNEEDYLSEYIERIGKMSPKKVLDEAISHDEKLIYKKISDK